MTGLPSDPAAPEGDAAEPAPAGVAATPSASPLARARLARLRERIVGDPVLAGEVAAFLAAGDGAWTDDGASARCEVAGRWCAVSATEIAIGHTAWPGSKRIPL